jgi:hypothetical protein
MGLAPSIPFFRVLENSLGQLALIGCSSRSSVMSLARLSPGLSLLMNFQACVPLVCELHLYYEESLFLKPH